MNEPIAYTYEADYHCPDCTEERFGRGTDGSIAGYVGVRPFGYWPKDREGNGIGAVAPWDEWQNIGEGDQTLVCGTCGAILDEYTEDNGGASGRVVR